MVSYHDMKNISYITQDPEDRRVLAYIAKDAKTEKHYCHVFRVDSFVSHAVLIHTNDVSMKASLQGHQIPANFEKVNRAKKKTRKICDLEINS